MKYFGPYIQQNQFVVFLQKKTLVYVNINY